MGIHLLSCVFGKVKIPQRYILTAMLHLALLNGYHLRVVLNIAIVEMQGTKNHTTKIDACPMFEYEEVPVQGGKFHWSNKVEAFILYAFFIGYVCSHIPGGWLADKIGARHVMGTCMLVTIITNLLYPTAIKLWDYKGAIALRVVIGIAQGPLLPTVSTFIQCWVPPEERSLLGAIAFSGANLGTVTGSIFTGAMIRSTQNWATPFYVWGLLALCWYVVYIIWVYSRPTEHPYITQEELKYLKTRTETRKSFQVPWCEIFKSVPVWALLFGQFAHNILYFTLFTNLPKFMKEILKLSLRKNTIYFALSFLVLWILSFVFAYFAKIMQYNWMIPLQSIRRWYTFTACFLTSVFLIIIPYVGCSRPGIIVLQTLAVGMQAPFYSGMKVNVNDITTHYGGLIMAIVNGISASAGVMGPYIIGALTNDESFDDWKKVFFIMGAMSVGCALVYLFLAKTERQSWDYLDDEEIEE